MTKRKTKSEVEVEGKARLRQRIMDIAIGANGGCEVSELYGEDGVFFEAMGPNEFFNMIQAIKRAFAIEDSSIVFEIWNLHHFATVTSSVDHLWEFGVRP